MKKTVIVNINGIIFHIDEDAYTKLSTYLDALHKYFDSKPEGKEIVSDIESRVAELLQPLISESKQSVTVEDIDSIIVTLGKPEDIAGSDDEAGMPLPGAPEQSHAESAKGTKKLYRDPDNAILGGVCSGLGAYFLAEPVLFRLIFLVFSFSFVIPFLRFGFSFWWIIVYIVLWIIMPKAKTAAQKLEMRGQVVTVSNLERVHVQSENSGGGSGGRFIRNVFQLIGRAFMALFRVFRFLIGIVFVLGSIVLIVSFIGAAFFNNYILYDITGDNSVSIREFISPFVHQLDINLLLIVLLLVIIIPFIGLMYAGIKMLVQFKARDKWAILSMFLLWLASVILCSFLVFQQVGYYKAKSKVKDVVTLSVPKNGVLHISCTEPKNYLMYNDLYGTFLENDRREFYRNVILEIERTTSQFPELEIMREARGETKEKALTYTKEIIYNYKLQDSLLNLEPVLRVNQNKEWKFYNVQVILRLPVGTKIYLNDNVADMLYYYHYSRMREKLLIMTGDGLEVMNSKISETYELKKPSNNSFYIETSDKSIIPESELKNLNNNNYVQEIIDDESFYLGRLRFDIKKSSDNKVKLIVEKYTSGSNDRDLSEQIKKIIFSFEQNDTVLQLDPVFRVPTVYDWNNQKVTATLLIPVATEVYLDYSIKYLIKDIHNTLGMYDRDMVKKRWKMTVDGLALVDAKKNRKH